MSERPDRLPTQTLNRVLAGLYTSQPVSEQAGLAFVPETDPGTSVLTLTGDITDRGRWLVWSNGPLTDAVSNVVGTLGAEGHHIVFSRGPYQGGRIPVGLRLGRLPDTELDAQFIPHIVDVSASVLTGMLEFDIKGARLVILNDGLGLAPQRTSPLLKGGGAQAAIRDLRILARGDRAGVLAFNFSPDFSALPSLGLRSTVTALGEATTQGFSTRMERRSLFRVDGQPFGRALPMDVVLDPLDATRPSRSFFVLPRGEWIRARFRSVHGHEVLLAMPPPKPEQQNSEPRLRIVLNRTGETARNEPLGFVAGLLPEGSFDLALAMPGSSRPISKRTETGLAVGDTPHEFLQIGWINEGRSHKLILRHNSGHIDYPQGSDDGHLTPITRPDQDVTLWAQLVGRNDDAEAVVSEARALRTLGLLDGFARDFVLQGADPRLLAHPSGFVPILPEPDPASATPGGDDIPVPARLSSARRRTLQSAQRTSLVPFANPLAKARPSGHRYTASGFEIHEDAQGNVLQIIFARGNFARGKGIVAISGVQDVSNPTGQMPEGVSAAVLQNKLFMAIDRDRVAGAINPDFALEMRMEVAGWGFVAALTSKPGGVQSGPTGTPGTMALIKGYEGLSIVQLAQPGNHKLWAGRRYVTDQQVAAKHILAFHSRITSGPLKDDPRYAALRTALTDPDWNGVLALDVNIDPAKLPNQIKGLMSGVEQDRFLADHIGFPVQRIPDRSVQPTAKPFAAIEYEASKDLGGASDGSYGFQVKRLAAGFANGQLQGFECDLQLRVGSLFEDTGIVMRKDGTTVPSKVLGFKGSYERRREAGRQIETFTFLTENDFDITFGADFPLLRSARIDQIGFSSSVREDPNNPNREVVRTSFLIDGDVDFKDLDLGFGDGAWNLFDLEKVDFGGLAIDMDFDIGLTGGGSVGWPRFSFNPGRLLFSFDKDRAKRTGGGLFSAFPIKWTGFGWHGAGISLPSLGYFSLSGSGNTGRTPYLLTFELDLGSMGALGSALRDFKMELGLAFGFSNGRPGLSFGFKFPSAGSKKLTIGIPPVLEMRAEAYELVRLKYDDAGTERTAWGFRGVGVELEIFGQTLPPDGTVSGVYIFADPTAPGSEVGWLIALVNKPSGNGSITLNKLALGQRVDPLPKLGSTPGSVSTQAVLEQLASAAVGMPVHDPDTGEPGDEVAIPQITYDPSRGWTIAFAAELFGFLGVGLAVRDPDLAGLRLDVVGLFEIDILYRKISDDLGVYSAEIALDESLRHYQFGAAGITIPALAVDVYTDGGWGVDIGYPHDKNFSRAFHLNILPLTGAGGFVFRRVSGAGATLIPAEGRIKDEVWAPYAPVTEVRMGARVGLGVAVGGGAFRAALSLTVYAYLNGAYGRLRLPQNSPVPAAARSYVVAEGTVGIMGELYGCVDFGIVRAGVSVTLWVEAGVRFETDKALRLHYEVGVRVRVSVVIARLCFFGKCLEIKISFAFGTTVRIEQTIGSDRRQNYRNAAGQIVLDASTLRLSGHKPDWTTPPAPLDWGAGAARLPLKCVLQPDVTVTFDPVTGEIEPQAVLLLASELTPSATILSQAAAASGAEELVRALAAWALKAHLNGLGDVDAATLRAILERIGDGDQPLGDAVEDFIGNSFDASADDLPEATSATAPERKAALLPLPASTRISLGEKAPYAPGDFNFVTSAYQGRVEGLLDAQMLAVTPPRTGRAPQSVASVLTQEWAATVMRNALSKMADEIDRQGGGDMAALDILAWLVTPHDVEKVKQTNLRSPAAEVIMQAGRSLVIGPRVPLPTDNSNVPDWIERPPAATPDWFQPLYRIAGLQFPIGPKRPVAIAPGTYGWLDMPEGLDPGEADMEQILALKQAAQDLDTNAGPVFNSEIRQGPLFDIRPRYVPLGSYETTEIIDNLRVWPLDELRGEDLPDAFVVGDTAQNADLSFSPVLQAELGSLVPAMVLDVAVELAEKDQAANPSKVALSIRGIDETSRALLDASLAGTAVIGDVRLYRTQAEGGGQIGGTAGQRPVVIKTNASKEIKPQSLLSLRGRTKHDVAVADTSQGAAFLELLRQAAIVNTGGFTLLVPASDWTAQPDPLAGGRRIRIVAELGTGRLVAARDPRLEYANALLGGSRNWPDQAVLAAEVGKMVNPLHEPGVLPLEAWRDHSDSTATREAGVLWDRFTAAAFEIALNGKMLLRRDQAVAVNSDTLARTPEKETEATNDTAPLQARASIPLGQLSGHTVSETMDIQSEGSGVSAKVRLYDLVGETVDVELHWRDVYGNLWGTAAAVTRQIVIQYSDRLVGLVGLPFVRLVQRPTLVDDTFALVLTFSFDAKALDAAKQENDGSAHILQARRTLQRCAAQLRDTKAKVVLSLGWAGNCQALPRAQTDRITNFLDDVADALAAVNAGKTPSVIANLDITAKTALPDQTTTTRPVEFFVELAVERLDPTTHRAFYPVNEVKRLLDAVSDDTAIAAMQEIHRVSMRVPSPTEAPLSAATSQPMTLEAYLDLLETAVAATHRVATGRSARPEGGAEAIWLVPRDMLDPLTEKGGLQDRTAQPFAFRPLANAAISHDFEDISLPPLQPNAPPSKPVRVIDADVDREARRVLDFLEELTSAERIIAGLDHDTPQIINSFQTQLLKSKEDLSVLLVQSQLGAVFEQQDPAPFTNRLKERVADRIAGDLTRYDTTGAFLLLSGSDTGEPDEVATVHGELTLPDGAIKTHPFSIQIPPVAGEDSRRDLLISFEQLGRLETAAPTSYRLTHVQRLGRESPGSTDDFGYRPTAWLKLHDAVYRDDPNDAAAWSVCSLAAQTQKVISPLRRLPKAPVLTKESFAPGGQPVTSLRDLRNWSSLHTLDFPEFESADKLESAVFFRTSVLDPRGTAGAQTMDMEPLPIRVLRFAEEIRDIEPASLFEGPDRAVLRHWLLERLSVLTKPMPVSVARSLPPALPKDACEITEKTTPLNDGSNTEVLSAVVKRVSQVAPSGAWLLGGSEASDEIGLPPEGQDAQSTFAAPQPRLRTLRLDQLDVLTQACAESEHRIVRNSEVGGKPLSGDFIYRTPIVASAELIVPVLDHSAPFALGEIAVTGNGMVNITALKDQLRDVFEELLGDCERMVSVDLVVEYETDVFLPTSGDRNWRELGGPLICAVTAFRDVGLQGIDHMAARLANVLANWSDRAPIRDDQQRPVGRILIDTRVYAFDLDGERSDDTRVLWLRRGELRFPGKMSGA